MTAPARVLWHSQFTVPTGYGVSSRHLVLALDALGVDVHVAGLYSPVQVEFPSSDPRLERMRRQPHDLSLPQVVYAQGDALLKNSGAYRIGYTMTEVDGFPAEWVQQANQMDEVWVPSRFNCTAFAACGLERPCYVMPLGIDPDCFCPEGPRFPVPGRFAFFSVFEWTERKGGDLLLEAYARAFAQNQDDVLLVLKVDSRDGGGQLRQFLNELQQRPGPPVALIHNQKLADEQMAILYRSADCFVLPTRGEGWGMPVLEAMACGLPAIATAWGGTLDFADEQNSYPLPVRGIAPARSRSPYYQGFSWADPDLDALVRLMRHVYENRAEARAKGQRAAAEAREHWTWRRAAERIQARLVEIRESGQPGPRWEKR